MIDSHAHLTYPEYGDEAPRSLIERAAAAGVERIVCVAYDIPSCAAVVDLAGREEEVSAVVGIHPHEADRATGEDLARVEELARRAEVVGIGETGLDYHRRYAKKKNQERLFHEHLALASRVGKPVVIHDRDAHDDVMAILGEHAAELPGGVMHCFSGDTALLEAVLALGFSISIPGTITFSARNDGRLAEVVRACPADRLLVETDCPWLTPAPHRGKRNEPAYVRYVVERVASIAGREAGEVDRITTENAERLFLPGG